MKVTFTFKNADAVQRTINEHVMEYGEQLEEEGHDHEDMEAMIDERAHLIQAEVERWFKYGEYVTIEIDVTAHTATVVKP